MSIRNGIRKATLGGMIFIIGVGLLIGACSSANASDVSPSAPLVIEYFFEPGCDDCARVNGKILPEVDAYYPGLCEIRRFDITQSTNYLHLAHYQISLNKEVNAPVSMVVNGRHLLADIDEIQGQLLKVLDEAIASGEVPSISSQSPEVGMSLLETRVQKFTVFGVMAAGLVDGINPCAISTLVFFMSILAMLHVRGRKLLLAGGAFCVASYITYFCIGLGLMHALDAVIAIKRARWIINSFLLGLLLLFAWLSFRDAWRFHRHHNPDQIALRLPKPIMLLIHALIRRGLHPGYLALSGFGIGVCVTALESICTGQVYVPTLVLVLRSSSYAWLATEYLLLYNLMFIMPLIIILVLVWNGLRMEHLLAWSRGHVVFSKCLLGLFFLAMGVLLVVM